MSSAELSRSRSVMECLWIGKGEVISIIAQKTIAVVVFVINPVTEKGPLRLIIYSKWKIIVRWIVVSINQGLLYDSWEELSLRHIDGFAWEGLVVLISQIWEYSSGLTRVDVIPISEVADDDIARM